MTFVESGIPIDDNGLVPPVCSVLLGESQFTNRGMMQNKTHLPAIFGPLLIVAGTRVVLWQH